MGTTPEEAYKQAVEGIFVQKEEVHRFAMPNQSHKHPHKSRWTLFEMWPINVSLAHSSMQCSAVQQCVMHCNTMQCNAMSRNVP